MNIGKYALSDCLKSFADFIHTDAMAVVSHICTQVGMVGILINSINRH